MFIQTTLRMICPDTLPLAAAGPVVMQGLGLLAMVLGVMLWLLGKRLARPACAGIWVILGMLAAGAICRLMGDGGLLPLWLVIGGIVTGAIGWMLYRVCLAMALALVLGLAVPAAVHFAQVGMPPAEEISKTVTDEVARAADDSKSLTDDISTKATEKTDEIVDAVKTTVKEKTTDAAEKVSAAVKKAVTDATDKITGKKDASSSDDTSKADSQQAASDESDDRDDSQKANDDDDEKGDDLLAAAPSASSVMAVLRSLVQGPWEKLSVVWQELSDDARKSMLGAALLGGLSGFFLGLIFPKLGAAAGSSLLGTLFMAAGCITILTYYNPSILTHLDNQTSLCLMALGLITLMGIGIQWTLERRRTDN
jgi:hypothetical protein